MHFKINLVFPLFSVTITNRLVWVGDHVSAMGDHVTAVDYHVAAQLYSAVLNSFLRFTRIWIQTPNVLLYEIIGIPKMGNI